MLPATTFQRGKQLGAADLHDAREMCPVCHSTKPRRPVYRIQRNPDIERLGCATCGEASASHMPTPDVHAAYFAQYYSDTSERYTMHDPVRFAPRCDGFWPATPSSIS
jgi:hypothetical protein